MLLYGTQFEGNSLRRDLGVEVEPYEMLEMIKTMDQLSSDEIADGVRYVKKTGFSRNLAMRVLLKTELNMLCLYLVR